MTDRPIIFSGPMVRALLEGRKTQTRRILTPHPEGDVIAFGWDKDSGATWTDQTFKSRPLRWWIGDRLWVRETVACGACAKGKPSTWSPSFWRRNQGTPANPNGLWYQADGLEPEKVITERGHWVSSIHMPRWASRLTLHVEDVRVERLQDISDKDALAEGMTFPDGMKYGSDPVDAFHGLWSSINGPGSWPANPWVVALTFRVERRNIASTLARAEAA